MGGGKQKSESGPSPEQRATQKFFLEDIEKPLGGAFIPMILEAISTGGSQAQIPFIQKALEQIRSATSRTKTKTSEGLARTGQSGSPFGDLIMALTSLMGETQASRLPTDYAQQLISLVPGLITGGGQISVAGPGVSRSTSSGGGFGAALGGIGQGIGNIFAAKLMQP